MSFAAGVVLITLPARYLLPSIPRLRWAEFKTKTPRLMWILNIREIIILLMIPVVIMGSIFFAYTRYVESHAHYVIGILALGTLAFVIGLLEIIGGLAVENGFAGRWRRSQKYLYAPQVRVLGMIRCGLSGLIIAATLQLAQAIA